MNDVNVVSIAGLDDESAAREISDWVRDWDRNHSRRYASLGLMLLEVERRSLWKLVTDPSDGFPFRSMARWIKLHAPGGVSTCYQALADVKELSDVPADAIAEIRESNFNTMKSLSTSVRRDPQVLRTASQGSNAELVAYVQEKHPNQAIERLQPMKLTFSVSQRAIVDEAIAKMKERQDANNAPECVERWAAAYLADCVLEEGYKGVATQVLQ